MATDDKQQKLHAGKIVRALKKEYPDADCALLYDSPFQLLIATILSAQCTDERVNIVTRKLFAKYPTAEKLAKASQSAVEKLIQSAGFYRNKAKNIRACCKQLVDDHDGEVPQEMSSLVELAGVGRKTANVVLGTAFGLATGVVVDTHVGRISKRFGLTTETDPVKIERDLMKLVPKREWVKYSHRVIHHGRQVCKARKALCDECTIEKLCPRIGVLS